MLALDRKLFRDMNRLRGQAFAIVAVMASGVACFIMFLSTLDSLQLSRELYYRDYRFAEVFAPLKRAPESVKQRIATIEGLDKIDTRVVAPITIDIEGFPEPLPAWSHPFLTVVNLCSIVFTCVAADWSK